VIGAGSFGKNHVRVYRELEAAGHAVRLAAIVEQDLARAAQLREQLGIPVFQNIEECLASDLRIDAASVCVPTSGHFAAAERLLRAGVHLLIEKPVASSLQEVDALQELSCVHGNIVQIGHLERFNPAVTAVQPHLQTPMFFEAHRLSVFTPRALDVDVVLDLMIHDLDIVLSIVKSPVREVRAVGLPILSRKVDIANVRLEFASGCVANFTASRVSTERVRKLRFFQPKQYVSIDYARRDFFVIQIEDQLSPEMLSPPSAGPENLPPGLAFYKPEVTPGEPLRLEIESFLNAVRTRQTPLVSLADGRAALAVALEINRTIAAHAKAAALSL
jgi:predicted dehydrogenase